MAYTQIRPQLKAKNNFWTSLKESFSAKKRAENREFEEALHTQKQSSNSEALQNKVTNAMNNGKTVTLQSPKSQRFTFNEHIAEQSPSLNNFKPKTSAEKESLSPNGFFRIGEVGAERQALTERKEKAAAESLGHELTEDQKELIDNQASNVPVHEAEIPSTAIKTVKYNPKTQALFVTFAGSNKKYFYPRVPQAKIEELMKAPSKGEYFIKNIHDVYTLNPGHSSAKNKAKNKVVKNYYKKMQKYYKNVMTKGHM